MMLVLSHLIRRKRERWKNQISVVSRRLVKKVERSLGAPYPHQTQDGHVARNELDTHADTCCAGANWRLMSHTGEICEVSPFLSSYDPVQEILVGRCCTVWTNQDDGQEYLLVGDQMLWFGTQLEHSLINPNQLRHYGLAVYDDPFSVHRLGIDSDYGFIPFDTTGTIVHFETRVPTLHEQENLPIILLTGEQWEPGSVDLQPGRRLQSREENELRTIRSLISGMRRSQVATAQMKVKESRAVMNGQVEGELGKISTTLLEKEFCRGLISAVNVGTVYREDVDEAIEANRQQNKVATVGTRNRKSQVTPEELARKWNIGLETAKNTLRVTTQKGIRQSVHPITRRVRVDHLHLHRERLRGTWYVDTMQAKVTSLRGNKCANIFTNGKFTKVVPMESRAASGRSLGDFIDDVGVPEKLVTDGASEFTGKNTEFVKTARRNGTLLHTTEQGRKNQNHAAEREIGILANRWKLRMRKKNVPKRLWDFGIEYESEIMSRMSRGRDGRTGREEVTGNTDDISEWTEFEFYDLVWWIDRPVKPDVTDYTWRLARWLGVSHRIGTDMCYYLVTESGKIISKTSVFHVTRFDRDNPETKAKIDEFDRALRERLDDKNFYISGEEGMELATWDQDEDVQDTSGVVTFGETGLVPENSEYGDMIIEDRPEADDASAIDKYLNAELILDVGTGNERRGTVTKRVRGPDGEPIGRAHANPLFDTREYEIEFTDGTTDRYTANVIAENMYAQVDDEGKQFQILSEITNHMKDGTAIPISDGMVTTRSGVQKPKITTQGWKLQVEWKDGSSSWVKLKDLKESNPVEVAEYAVTNRLVEEPAFKWWVHHVLKKRNRIIAKMKSKYWRVTHKFGIKLPHSVEEALRIDAETGTDFWRRAIEKEMRRVKIAWREFEHPVTPDDVRKGKVKELIGYQEIRCHIVFDVKMNFERKARFCAGGHMTETPASITYSSVVSRDSIRIGFMLAALNGIDVLACDLENAYLNAPVRERIWFEGGVECGDQKGKVLVIVRALYGLKSAGSSWRSAFAEVLRELGFQSTRADPDVWIRAAQRPDGFKYYEMLFVYVDDVLAMSHRAREVIDSIGEIYKVKPGSDKSPDIYLGANIEQIQTPDGRMIWSMSSRDYVKNAVEVCENLLKEDGEGKTLRKDARGPLPTGYRPELDVTRELGPELVSRYLQLIGILRWAIELGRLDIFYEVAILSQHQANPREGHLEAAYHVFAYLKKYGTRLGKLGFDPKDPNVDESIFKSNLDWTDFYGDVEEEIPGNMPEPLGNPVTIHAFVDANHAGNVVTRRSHTGIIIFIQNAPIIWYSKRQNTVEAATFGSEFVALRICKELLVSLRYKLRMFGVPLEGPANVFCDNRGVVKNASLPESTLQKKHNAINYHAVREAVAADILRVGKEDGDTNLADLLTKVVSGQRRWDLCYQLFW